MGKRLLVVSSVVIFLGLAWAHTFVDSIQANSSFKEHHIHLQALASEHPHWIQTNGPYGGQIRTIEIVHSNPDVMYAAGLGGCVFKSVNAGEKWTALEQIVACNRFIDDIIASPQDPNTLYALAGQLYKSVNGGESWQLSIPG